MEIRVGTLLKNKFTLSPTGRRVVWKVTKIDSKGVHAVLVEDSHPNDEDDGDTKIGGHDILYRAMDADWWCVVDCFGKDCVDSDIYVDGAW